jgi:hypothetical protein
MIKMPKAEAVAKSRSPASAGVATRELAAAGWVVEVVLVIGDRPPDRRLFAVGLETAAEAREAVLRFPGIVRADERTARRPLSANELSSLRLRTGAVRSYGTATEPSFNS